MGSRKENIYCEQSAVGDPLEELRTDTLLQMRMNYNISPDDELFDEYGDVYMFRA